MARDLTIGIEARGAAEAGKSIYVLGRAFDDLGDEMSSAGVISSRLNRDLARVEAQAAIAAKSVTALDRAFDNLDEQMSDAARASNRLGRDLASLDAKILASKAAAKALASEFAATGNVDILKKFRAQNANTSSLTSLRKELSGVSDELKRGANEASTFASFLQGGVLDALKTPAGAAAAAAVAIPATINIGATIGGFIGGGVGVGAAGAAVAGAAIQSEQVHAVWSHEIAGIKQEYLDATKPAIEPTIAAIQRIGSAVRGLNLKQIFGDAAQFIEPLARGISDGLTAAGHGLEYLVHRAGPSVAALSDGAAEVGHGFDSAFKEIADGSVGGGKALEAFAHDVAIVVAGTGRFIGWMEDAYDAVDKLSQKLAEIHPVAAALNDLWGNDEPKVIARTLDDATRAAGDATSTFRGLNVELYSTADAATVTNEAFHRLYDEEFGLADAHVAAQQGLLDLKETLKENRGALDDHTKAGLANEETLLRQANLYRQERDAAIAAGNGTKEATDAANAAYQHNIQGLIALARQFGISEAAVRAFLGPLLAIPDQINTSVNVYHHDYYSSSNSPIGPEERKYGPRGYASGTNWAPAGWAWVGEQGPELMRLQGGERVLNSAASARMAFARPAGRSTPSGGTPTQVVIQLSGGSDLERAVIAHVMKSARVGQFTIPSTAVV